MSSGNKGAEEHPTPAHRAVLQNQQRGPLTYRNHAGHGQPWLDRGAEGEGRRGALPGRGGARGLLPVSRVGGLGPVGRLGAVGGLGGGGGGGGVIVAAGPVALGGLAVALGGGAVTRWRGRGGRGGSKLHIRAQNYK